jgi:hypothetical protein
MTDENRPEANEEELIDAAVEAEEIEDPIGDETDGEAKSTVEEAETEPTEAEIEEEAEDEAYSDRKPIPNRAKKSRKPKTRRWPKLRRTPEKTSRSSSQRLVRRPSWSGCRRFWPRPA